MCVAALAAIPPAGAEEFDVVIYGGTPAGITAALGAKREGAKVVLIEPTGHLGGIVSSGLGGTDHCVTGAIGGEARRLFEENGSRLGRKIEWRIEPGVAEELFDNRVSDVTVIKNERVVSAGRSGAKLHSLTTSSGREFAGKVFIDASYEGDLLPLAGVSYAVGRESSEQYGEPSAGVFHTDTRDQFPAGVTGLDREGKLLPGVAAEPPGPRGSADRKLPAFNYRPCVTKDPARRVPFAKPEGYDAREYELLIQYLRARPETRYSELFTFLKLPNNKVDLNNKGPFSTDFIGRNWEWAEGSPESRARMSREHEIYTRGLFWFLANDPRVPVHIREPAGQFGLCADEFEDNDHWPYQLYVREGRRMLGQYVMKQQDLRSRAVKPDSIGLASCPIESHHMNRFRDETGRVVHEGWVSGKVTPYRIPYRSVTPKREESVNLLVPVAVSASHIAYTSLRMEPVFMILGESSGIAAATAARTGAAVQDVPYDVLRAKLLAAGQVLEPPKKEG